MYDFNMPFFDDCPLDDSLLCEELFPKFDDLHEAIDHEDFNRASLIAEDISRTCEGCPHAASDWVRSQYELGKLSEDNDVLGRLCGLKTEWGLRALLVQARLRRDADEFEEAILWYEKACELDPADHDAACEMASTLVAVDRWQDAESFARKAVDNAPEEPHSLAQLIAVLTKHGTSDEALELRKLVDASTWQNTREMLAAALQLREAGDSGFALELCKRAIQLEPANSRPLCLAARLCAEDLEDYQQGLDLFRALLDADPKYHGPSCYLEMARIHGDAWGDWKTALGLLIEGRIAYSNDEDLAGYAEHAVGRLSGTVAEMAEESQLWRRKFEALQHDHVSLRDALREMRASSAPGIPLGLALLEGEGQSIEFMAGYPTNARELAREVAAFSTSNDGNIYLGVEDDGTVCGIQDISDSSSQDALLQRISGLTSGPIRPHALVDVSFIPYEETTVVRIFVYKGARPVYYVSNTPYIRDLDKSRPADADEVEELFRRAGISG